MEVEVLRSSSGIAYGLRFVSDTPEERAPYAAFAEAVKHGWGVIKGDELTSTIILEDPAGPPPYRVEVIVGSDFKDLVEALLEPGQKPRFHAVGKDFVLIGRG